VLDLRRLRIFTAVAESGSFTAAAQSLFLTHSAVSQQMSLLEREVGVPLFKRLPRGVEMTPAGQLLAKRAQGLFTELLSIEQGLRHYNDGAEEVRLAAFGSAGAELLPQALRQYASRHPGVRVDLCWPASGDALGLLMSGDVHMTLLWDYDFDPLPVDPTFTRIPLQRDPLVVILPLGHRLSGQDEIALADLAGERWIAREHRPPYGDAYEKMLRIAGLPPDIAFRADDYHAVQGFVAAGFGVSLAPLLSVTPHRLDVVVRPTRGTSFARQIAVLTLPGGERHEPIGDLIAVLQASSTGESRADGS
jgi:DNA-binding transcriptional LysR family regulator